MAILSFFRPSKSILPASVIFKIFGVGALVALHWVFFYGSIKYANVSIGLVCFSAIGFFTAFFEPLIMRKKLDWVEVLLGGIAIAGIALIFHFDERYKLGILLGIISTIFAALFTIFNKKLLKYTTPESLTFYELSGGLVTLTILMPFYIHAFPPDHILPTTMDFVWLLVLSWLCTVVAFSLSVSSLKKISAFTASLSYNLEPLYGIILAFALYQENKYLGISFYWGISLICITVFIQTYRLYKARG
ncbi:MAG: DMT family transporter [Agriterribacter sp.]